MLKVEESLGRGEFVCLLADRSLEGEAFCTARPGRACALSAWPFRVAALLKRPSY